MRQKLLLLALTVLCSVVGLAQSQNAFTVKGVLLDSLTNEGEPYATIKIVKKGVPNKAVKMAVTRAQGKFQERLAVPPGDYLLTITSIGKSPVVKAFALKSTDKVVDLGTLYTSDDVNQLKGVEVVAQKPLVKVDVDKIEYNIEDDPDSKTNNVLEMLRKVPLVTVDGEDNIQVNGSSSFKVHVNGKPNTMMSNNPKEVLKSMPANAIKHIEVITSPGAKYDAEGVGGILNIVTVGGGIEGYTANLRAGLNNSGANVGGYATVKKGKLTVSANYSFNRNSNPRGYHSAWRENYNSDTEKYLDSEGSFKNKGSFQYGSLEASYEIDTLRLLSMSFAMYGGDFDNNSDGRTVMYGANNKDITYKYSNFGFSNNSWYSISGNVDYQRVSKRNKQRMLTLSYRLNSNPQTDDSKTVYDEIDPQSIIEQLKLKDNKADGKSNTFENTLQLDYTTPIGKIHTVETGLKYILRNNTSDNRFYETESGKNDYQYQEARSSKYEHLNHIVSAYLGYTLRYKEFSFKPGLRYEHTEQSVDYKIGSGSDFKARFDDLVPSVSLGVKIGKMQNVRLLYDMRISRPGIWYLNPYFDDRNPMNISQGNSELKSEKTHSFDLSYSRFSAKFNINAALRHSFGNNGIEQISRLITTEGGEDIDAHHHVPQGALYSTYENTAKKQETGMSLYLNWNMTSKTRFYVNGRGSYMDIRSDGRDLRNTGWTGSAYAGVQQTLPLKVRLSLNAGGSTPSVNLQGKGSGYSYYSLSLNRSFLKEDRLTVSAFCSNIFEKYRRFENTTIGENFYSKNSTKFSTRRFGISISYRLGELKAGVKKAARSIVNDDVKSGGGNASGGGEAPQS